MDQNEATSKAMLQGYIMDENRWYYAVNEEVKLLINLATIKFSVFVYDMVPTSGDVTMEVEVAKVSKPVIRVMNII